MAERDVRNVKDHLICSICIDTYVDPKVLPCGHSFCKLCLTGYFQENIRSIRNNNRFQCPVDRETFEVRNGVNESPDALASSFPDNFFLKDLKSVIVHYDGGSSNTAKLKCSKHKGQLNDCFCMKCLELICGHCALENHNSGKCRSHTIEQAVTEIQKKVATLKSELLSQRRKASRQRRRGSQWIKDSLEPFTKQISDIEKGLEEFYHQAMGIIQTIKTSLASVKRNQIQLENIERDIRTSCNAVDSMFNTNSNLGTINAYVVVQRQLQAFQEALADNYALCQIPSKIELENVLLEFGRNFCTPSENRSN